MTVSSNPVLYRGFTIVLFTNTTTAVSGQASVSYSVTIDGRQASVYPMVETPSAYVSAAKRRVDKWLNERAAQA